MFVKQTTIHIDYFQIVACLSGIVLFNIALGFYRVGLLFYWAFERFATRKYLF